MKRVDCLDGLRGLAALWVLVGHSMILTGWHLPILSSPDLGVDLFILLSGFLMVFQYHQRSGFEDWSRSKVWIGFWIRRLFRIAPLFYVLLAVALLLGPHIYADRVFIDTGLGHQLQKPERYMDASLTNVLVHLSFFFGLVPDYAFRTPLPDWSLGLEMQFYAIFPFLVLLARRLGWLQTAVVVMVLSASAVFFIKANGIEFPMPSFLPLKMHLFLCGMLIAADSDRESTRGAMWARVGFVVVLAALPIGGGAGVTRTLIREMLVLGFFALIHLQWNTLVNRLAKLLSTPFFYWLGTLSYGVYLVHLLIMHRVVAWAFAHGLAGHERFFVTLGVTATFAYSIAAVTYFLVEKPGQRLGKSVVRWVVAGDRKPSPVAVSEGDTTR